MLWPCFLRYIDHARQEAMQPRVYGSLYTCCPYTRAAFLYIAFRPVPSLYPPPTSSPCCFPWWVVLVAVCLGHPKGFLPGASIASSVDHGHPFAPAPIRFGSLFWLNLVQSKSRGQTTSRMPLGITLGLGCHMDMYTFCQFILQINSF